MQAVSLGISLLLVAVGTAVIAAVRIGISLLGFGKGTVTCREFSKILSVLNRRQIRARIRMHFVFAGGLGVRVDKIACHHRLHVRLKE